MEFLLHQYFKRGLASFLSIILAIAPALEQARTVLFFAQRYAVPITSSAGFFFLKGSLVNPALFANVLEKTRPLVVTASQNVSSVARVGLNKISIPKPILQSLGVLPGAIQPLQPVSVASQTLTGIISTLGVAAIVAPSESLAAPPLSDADAASVVNDAKSLGDGEISLGVSRVPTYDSGTDELTVPSSHTTTSTSAHINYFGGSATLSDTAAATELSDAKNAYGNNSAMSSLTTGSKERLTTGTTPQSIAYQAIIGGASQPQSSLQNEAWVAKSEDALTTGVQAMMQDCTETYTHVDTSASTHIPDIHVCDRGTTLPSCSISRVFTNPTSTTQTVLRYQGNVDANLFFNFTINQGFGSTCSGNNNAINGCGGSGFYTYAAGGWGNYGAWEGWHADLPATLTVTPLTSVIGNNGAGQVCNLTAITPTLISTRVGGGVTTMPSAANGWVGHAQFWDGGSGEGYADFKLDVTVQCLTEQFIDTPAGCRQQWLNYFTAEPSSLPACTDCTGSLNREASNAAFSCTDASNSRTFGTINVTPSNFGGSLSPLFYGAPVSPPAPICYEANFNNGAGGTVLLNDEGPCPIDPTSGLPECTVTIPPSSSELTNCTELENNSNCVFKHKTCDAYSPVNPSTCASWTETYDCGVTTTYSTGSSSQSKYSCGGWVRCMGQDCVDNPVENNKNFGRTTAMLQVADQAGMHGGSCDGGDPAACELFKGTKFECKIVFWGVVDCCKQGTVNMGGQNWITNTISIYRLYKQAQKAGAMKDLKALGLDVEGAWSKVYDTATTPITAAYTEITKPLYNAWDSIKSTDLGAEGAKATVNISNTIGGAGEMVTGLLTQAQSSVAQWTEATFGTEIRKALFSEVKDASGEVLAGKFEFAGSGTLAGSMLTAWGYYQMFVMIANIIWKCENNEFQALVKRELHLCEYVGSYQKKAFGVPYKKSHVWCCWQTIFGKVLGREVRNKQPSIKTWGSGPQNADCSGFTAQQIGAINFDLVDFSEWSATLSIAGINPPGGADLDDWFSKNNTTMHKNAGSAAAGPTQTGDGPTTEAIIKGTLGEPSTSTVGDDARWEVRNSLL